MPRSLRRVYGQRVIGEKREQNSGQRGVKGLRITIMRNVREVENVIRRDKQEVTTNSPTPTPIPPSLKGHIIQMALIL